MELQRSRFLDLQDLRTVGEAGAGVEYTECQNHLSAPRSYSLNSAGQTNGIGGNLAPGSNESDDRREG